MKIFVLFAIFLVSIQSVASTELADFANQFNLADCVDEAQVSSADGSREVLYNIIEKAIRSDEGTTITIKVDEGIDYFKNSTESYCDNALRAQRALEKLIKSDNFEKLVAEIKDTGDDDSTESFIIMMKDGTHTSLRFGN